MTAEIRVAYATSRHGYRARAFVLDRGVKHSFAVGLGDTADEAIDDAVRYVREMHERDGVPAPERVNRLGRMSGAIVDGNAF